MEFPLKQFIQEIFRRLGYEVKKIQPFFPSDAFDVQYQFIHEIGKSNITILDVGANKGQTAERYRAKFPNAEIYCFEPFPNSVDVLQKKFAHDEQIHILPMAVANESGRKTFYLNGTDTNHSILPRPFSGRRYYFKREGPKGNIDIQTITLDEFVASYQVLATDILKFDIQGGELMALHGAKTLLRTGDISLIYTEVSFVHHYEGAPLFHELSVFLADFGYSLFEIYDIYKATNGQIRLANALFVSASDRNDIINKSQEEP